MRSRRRRRALALAGLATLLLLGACYQAVAALHDRQRYTVPGQLVRIGGRFVHLDCRGEGSPTVVFASGMDGSSLDWFELQPQVAGFTRNCSYDRPGTGWSQTRQRRTSVARAAGDLALLLEEAGEEGPFVLVGHSLGGVLVRAFAHNVPDRVAGLVLIDSWHEGQRLRLPRTPLPRTARFTALLRLCRLTAPFGIPRLLGVMERGAAAFPFGQVRGALIASMNRSGYCGALLREQLGFRRDLARAEGPSPLGDLPLVVISRGRAPTPAALPPATRAHIVDLSEAAWAELQADLVALSSRGVQLTAQRSGHDIAADQPGLVVAAIRGMVAGLRLTQP